MILPRRNPPIEFSPGEFSPTENSTPEYPRRIPPRMDSTPATYNNSIYFPISLTLHRPYDILFFLPREAEL